MSPVLWPPHARWHLKVSQAVKSTLSLSLSLSSLPTTPLHSLTQLVSPHFSPTLLLLDNPTHFLFSPLGPRPTGLHPSSSSLSLQRFHSFSGGRRFQYRVNRMGNLSRHWEMVVEPQSNTYNECLGITLRAQALSTTNYHILKDFSRFLFLTPTSFPFLPSILFSK